MFVVSTNVLCIQCMPSYKNIMHAGNPAHADSLGHAACQLDEQFAPHIINYWANSQSICSVRLWRRHAVPALPDASLEEGGRTFRQLLANFGAGEVQRAHARPLARRCAQRAWVQRHQRMLRRRCRRAGGGARRSAIKRCVHRLTPSRGPPARKQAQKQSADSALPATARHKALT